jgi:uncharacterized protein
LKTSNFYYFLKAPVLKLPTEQFPFSYFETLTTESFSETTDFPSQLMLGKQAEYIFENYLKQSQRYEICRANIQVQGAQETLGELDYLVTDTKTAATLHIELACKFYLLDENLGTPIMEQWIGPNRKDKLADKLEKIQARQFPLLQREETVSLLADSDLEISKIAQHYCMKAFLFVPKYYGIQKLPKYFQECLTGYYLNISQLAAEKEVTALYALPQKKEWLLPPENLTNWIPFSEVKKHITAAIAEKRSPLVYKKLNGGIEKFFVVWW